MNGRSQLDFETEYMRGEPITVSTDKTIAQIASDAYAEGFAVGRVKPQTYGEIDAAMRYLAGQGLLRKDITLMAASAAQRMGNRPLYESAAIRYHAYLGARDKIREALAEGGTE